MLIAKNLSKVLWAEAVNTAVFVLNRAGPSSVEEQTPIDLFTGKTGHLNKLHIFGTECHVLKGQRKKWDPKGQKVIFVGYSEDIDGYRVWMQPGNRIVRSRVVVFSPEKAGKTLALLQLKEACEHNPENQQLRVPVEVVEFENAVSVSDNEENF